MDVEIWSDIACPWCYVGKRRFEAALGEYEGAADLSVTFRSFELDPSAPAETPGDRTERLAAKYGMTVEEARAAEAQLTAVAAEAGLVFRFDIARSANTFDAHRVVHLAREHGVGAAAKERLLRAHFTEGRLLSDPDTLVALGSDVGIPEDETRELLAGDRFAEAVREEEHTATALGITAVPTFVVDRQLAVSGAQSPQVLLSLLREGARRAELSGSPH